jgi:hypothetical protein
MDVDLSNFEKEDFSINGFYRALVEDNVDPMEAGRVRVRILGIHSMDILEAPTENLPWAEPVLPLAHSGGANTQQIDFKPGVAAVPKTKFMPVPVAPPLVQQLPLPIATDAVNRASTEAITIPTHRDTAVCNSGTGGQFTVPAKGSLVWIFFDGGCHLRPHYFAMATQMRDWKAQKLKLVGDLKDRDAITTNLSALLAPGADNAPHAFTSEAAAGQASVSTALQPPSITPTAPPFITGTRLENLTSWTSPGGTTIISDHTWKNEQLYIMHKGYSHYVDSKGQVTKIVGTTAKAPTTAPTAFNPVNGAGLPNDETEINAGLKNIYIVGDYNLFVMGNCFIQCQQSVQINAMANVGVVSRAGNVNVLAETGSINLESSKGSVNIKGLNVQIEADNNITLKSKKLIDLNSAVDIQMKSVNSLNMNSAFIHNTADTNFSVETTSIKMNASAGAVYSATASTDILSAKININGDASVLVSSPLIEANGAASINLMAPDMNIKGATVSVNADGVVNVLGASANVFGTASAMVGGAATVIGGATTMVTGIVTLGLGTVAPATPAKPVTQVFAPPTMPTNLPYVDNPIIQSIPDVTIVPTKSKIIV